MSFINSVHPTWIFAREQPVQPSEIISNITLVFLRNTPQISELQWFKYWNLSYIMEEWFWVFFENNIHSADMVDTEFKFEPSMYKPVAIWSSLMSLKENHRGSFSFGKRLQCMQKHLNKNLKMFSPNMWKIFYIFISLSSLGMEINVDVITFIASPKETWKPDPS